MVKGLIQLVTNATTALRALYTTNHRGRLKSKHVGNVLIPKLLPMRLMAGK